MIQKKGNALKKLLLLLLLTLPAVMNAQFTFTTNNGAITITRYTGSDDDVLIPSITNGYPVTSIGNSAFLYCSSVTNVNIPESITNIDVQAFTDCGLISVTIPDSVINIGQSAFLDCSSLVCLSIGNSVINIGYDAFWGCSSLTKVVIPNSVTNLKSTAFAYCSSLTNITVNPQNPAYSSVAGVLFDKNQTTLMEYPYGLAGSYTIPSSVTNIGRYSFLHCIGLTNLTIPNSVIIIEPSAVSGCASLANIIIPISVTTIGQSAFSGCASLTNIIIPNSVTNIGAGAFLYCSRLTAITVDTNNPAYSSVAGVLFNFTQTTLVEFPMGKAGNYFKPTSFTVPDGVTCIGDWAFASCSLTNVVIPNGVTSIGSEAFQGTRLTRLTIPNSVTNIGDGAFAASSLTNITIPASVTTLGWLGHCPHHRSVYFQGNAPGHGNGIPPVLFLGEDTTVYYLPGTTGWTEYFQVNLPTVLWLPKMLTTGVSFGVWTNQFGFNINWASGQTVVVEACTNLSNPYWQPVQTNTLTSDSAHFSDPQWTNYPGRFYRLRSP